MLRKRKTSKQKEYEIVSLNHFIILYENDIVLQQRVVPCLQEESKENSGFVAHDFACKV